MRIAGITIPEQKRIDIGLTSVYGIGRQCALRVLERAGIDPSARPKDLTTDDETKIRKSIEEEGLLIEGELRRNVGAQIKRLKDIASYRGTRHIRKLPCRGQRTKTNARTLKGSKKTMGSGRRKVEKK